MLVKINALGYKGMGTLIEETEKGYEVQLEGKNTRLYISKNSTSETVEIVKFTSKVNYAVERDNEDYNPETGKYESPIVGRSFELTITSSDEDKAYSTWSSFYNYFKANASFNIEWCGCPSIEEVKSNKVSYCDIIPVGDKQEYDELKELYKEFKKELGIR